MPLALHPATWIRPQRLRAWAAWLVLALCFSGTLGQMHRVLHAPGLPALQAADAVQASLQPHDHAPGAAPSHAHAHPHAHGWLDGLFGIHTDSECRLYDQLSGDPALPGVPLVWLPLQLPTAQLLMRAGDFIARWVALFDARGPPRVFVLPL